MSKKNSPRVILHIVYSGLGGIASVFFSLVEASKTDNYKHVVAFYGVEPLLDDYATHCDALDIKYRSFIRKPRLDFHVNSELYNWVEQIAPDAIVVNLPRALPSMARYRRKFPKTALVGVEHHPNILKRTVDWIDSINFSRHCTHTVYLTTTYKKEVKEKIGWFFREKNSVVIPNGINTNKFCPTQRINQNRKLRIGMCSRLTSSKDITTLINAFAISRNQIVNNTALLTIAGDGPEKENLQREVNQLGLENSVKFEGFLAERELINWLNGLDLYVHASLSETMSTSIMQALSCGLPCIVSDLPGMQELVPPETGYIVPTKQPAALSDKISHLLQNADERDNMRNKAREHATRSLDQSQTWARYKKIL